MTCDVPLKIYAFVHWITLKEIHIDRIPQWCQEIAKVVCMFEKELDAIFIDL